MFSFRLTTVKSRLGVHFSCDAPLEVSKAAELAICVGIEPFGNCRIRGSNLWVGQSCMESW